MCRPVEPCQSAGICLSNGFAPWEKELRFLWGETWDLQMQEKVKDKKPWNSWAVAAKRGSHQLCNSWVQEEHSPLKWTAKAVGTDNAPSTLHFQKKTIEVLCTLCLKVVLFFFKKDIRRNKSFYQYQVHLFQELGYFIIKT